MTALPSRRLAIHSLLITLGAALALPIGVSFAASPAAVVEPVTLLDGRTVAGCGFSARFDANPALEASLVVTRDGDGTRFTLRAGTGVGATGAGLSDLRLTTLSHDSRTLFPGVRKTADGGVVASATLDSFAGASLMQELLVSGGHFAIALEGRPAVDLSLPQPMPHTVRQSYLACAGDLFRPGTP